jgi:hypothetical protein
MRPTEIRHEFPDGVDARQPLAPGDERDAGGGLEGRKHFGLLRPARQLYRPVVEVADGFRHFDGHRHHIQLGIDVLRVGSLMARNTRLRNERIHDSAKMALPWIGRATKKRATRTTEQPCPFQRRQRADDRGGVTGDNTSGLPSDRRCVVHLGHEGVARHRVRLAAFNDELDACSAIRRRVLGTKLPRGAVDDDIGLL